ncbi:ABC transporter substrate-binding protein [Pseudarthrobacter sp. C4D7]|uniref:ABC transporter substrate-binding protein n=1 Tax=Pseudarthrobacter sp. C4D7 TaxID=2735268 RepID=UPI001584A3CF|nr:ABC transporter substrate-binding protein [Pseudarthrobacter sp. C4D7]NUT69968.1 amino acid ABC transporter substrate-binding protein [Pseudarthrobacter sp. C4D7]
MKIKAMKWLTTAPVALALAVSLAACGGGSSQPSGTPTDALAGSDQQTLDKYTTASVTPVDKIDKSKLGLITEGTLRVGTLSDAPPNIFIDPSGKFTGYDNELLRAIGDKLGLKVEFASTDFSALLSQVANKQFDVGSSSISTTDARRKTVGFTNGYDFGYMAVVTKNGSKVNGFADLKEGLRIGVVQGTVQDDYVTNTLKIEPVRFPDYNTVYGNVKNGQIDAWVAPSQQATGQVKDGDNTKIAEKVVNTQNFTAYAVNKDNQPLIDALNAGLDAVIADGTWSKLTSEWYEDRPTAAEQTPQGWKPGSKAVQIPAAK